MNIQPEVMKGYYIDNKNIVHRLIDFALIGNTQSFEEMVIYQPQQIIPNIPTYILLAAPKEIFFENVNMHTPRFRFLGRIEDEIMQALKQYELDVKPEFKQTNMLNKTIEELVFKDMKIRGFALHNKTLKPQIIYNRHGSEKLMILPDEEFFKIYQRKSNKYVAPYLNELKAAEEILKEK
jgi:hypothetical protein